MFESESTKQFYSHDNPMNFQLCSHESVSEVYGEIVDGLRFLC